MCGSVYKVEWSDFQTKQIYNDNEYEKEKCFNDGDGFTVHAVFMLYTEFCVLEKHAKRGQIPS